jgi:hypothetical protein
MWTRFRKISCVSSLSVPRHHHFCAPPPSNLRGLRLRRGSTPYDLFASTACSSAKPSERKEGCVRGRVPTRPPQAGTFAPAAHTLPATHPRGVRSLGGVCVSRGTRDENSGRKKTQGEKLDALPGYSAAWPAPVRTVLVPLSCAASVKRFRGQRLQWATGRPYLSRYRISLSPCPPAVRPSLLQPNF